MTERPQRRRRLAWIFVGAVVAGTLALNLLAYSHARAMMRFTQGGARTPPPEALSWAARIRTLFAGINIPRPARELPPSALAPDCRVLSIDGPDGVALAAWYCDRGPDTPLVALFHGYGADKTFLIAEANALLETGASVLVADFRGSGGSSESYTTIGVLEAEDVAAVLRYARERLAHGSLILFGQSMGAAAILRAAREHGIAPDGVILEAVFDTMLNTVRNRFVSMGVPSFPAAHLLVFWGGRQWGFNGFSHNPIEYASSLRCPALFMHGAEDPRTTPAQARRVFAAVPGRKSFTEFAGTGHESYILKHPAPWRAAVESFMSGVGD